MIISKVDLLGLVFDDADLDVVACIVGDEGGNRTINGVTNSNKFSNPVTDGNAAKPSKRIQDLNPGAGSAHHREGEPASPGAMGGRHISSSLTGIDARPWP